MQSLFTGINTIKGRIKEDGKVYFSFAWNYQIWEKLISSFKAPRKPANESNYLNGAWVGYTAREARETP